MKRLHLVRHERGANPGRTAVIMMALNWVPQLVLCVSGGLAVSGVKIPFLYDIGAHTRFLIAVPVLLLADVPIGVRLGGIMRHLASAHLVLDDGWENSTIFWSIPCGFAIRTLGKSSL